MKHGRYPYRGMSAGLADFGDSLCERALYDSTRIERVLHNFRVSGVIPNVGRTALPADVVFGDYDFNTLRARIDELHAQGVTEEQVLQMLSAGGNLDSAQAVPAQEVSNAAPGANPEEKPAQAGQGESPEQL